MGKVYNTIDETLATWIKQQRLFFVATAPLAGDGLINCSPKGLDSFVVLGPNTVAYLDLTGSGVETIAHLRENGRIVIMFCALEGPAKIIRLHGTGSAITPDQPEFAMLCRHFPDLPGVRSVIKVEVSRISDSCGYGVPLYEFKRNRPSLIKHCENIGPEGVLSYQAENNQYSLDGLPALAQSERAPQ